MTIINVLFLKLNTTAKILESALVLCFISFSRPPRVPLYRVLSRHYYDFSSRPSVVTLTSFLVFVELPGITLFSQTWWSCWSGLVVLLASSLGFDPWRRPRHDLHRANLFLQHAHTHTHLLQVHNCPSGIGRIFWWFPLQSGSFCFFLSILSGAILIRGMWLICLQYFLQFREIYVKASQTTKWK